ncbi:hypothetical protein ACW9JY_09565 [Petrotoga sp. DB-2]
MKVGMLLVQLLNNLQISYAYSLLVDYEKLKQAQESHDVIETEETLKEAYETDVRGILK